MISLAIQWLNNSIYVPYKIISICLTVCILTIDCGTTRVKPPAFTEDLDSFPVLINKIEPIYPQRARELGLQGGAVLYLFVTTDGDVQQVKIDKSTGNKMLDTAAVEYAKQLKFKPAVKNEKPISIWLTWKVDYTLEPPFDPNEYVRQVKWFIRRAEKLSGEQRRAILRRMLNAHESYVRCITQNPDLNYNYHIRKFIKPRVYKRWKNLWQDVSLQFIVYHDFVVRYPDSGVTSDAITRLLELIKDDINRIKRAAAQNQIIEKKKDLFLRDIYTFLMEKYPQDMTEELKLEARKYIEEK